MFGYQYPEICVKLETISEMFDMPPESIDEYQWAVHEALINTSIAAKRSEKLELSDKMSNSGDIFAQKINRKRKSKTL